MINVILVGLMSFAQPTISANYVYNNNVVDLSNDISITPLYQVQSGNADAPYGYRVYFNETMPTNNATHYITINTSSGQIPLKFTWMTTQIDGNNYWYQLMMEYNSDETYNSNLYLDNFYVLSDGYGDELDLPNVYFNGSSDIMASKEEGTFGFDFYGSGDNFQYCFDLKIFPSSMINDGSAYVDGFNEGYGSGYQDGKADGYNDGYSQGVATAEQGDFMHLFNSIADTPLRFLYGLFSFDLFGTSMLVIILTLLTAIVLFGVIKKFWK